MLLLRNGLVSKALLAALPVVLAVIGFDADPVLAAGLRFVEYSVGAVLGALTVVAVDLVSRALWAQDHDPAEMIAG